MTNKRALADIRYLVLFEIDNLKNREIWKSYFDQIEKDLEVLEILKDESDEKKIIERNGIASFHLNMILTTYTYNKIKEWLER